MKALVFRFMATRMRPGKLEPALS